jgi:hypothetical protein
MTISQARDEMLSVFTAAWEGDPTSAPVPVLYPDRAQEIPTQGPWARARVQHNASAQVTLSGEAGARRFRRTGVVSVEIFTPTGDGLTLSDQLAMIASRAFEGVTTEPGRVIFRNVRVTEAGQDGAWHKTDVLADFEYDEVR